MILVDGGIPNLASLHTYSDHSGFEGNGSNINEGKKEYVDSLDKLHDWLQKRYNEHAGSSWENLIMVIDMDQELSRGRF
ncbi:hypothetical protein [Treponema pedis]|uniref:hypothetical protein n=1 Tax=Treponema pedis TaxID=409322 RepID=UPI0004017CFE|nr:hypothetical protein [Treponema pedis]